ncbi:MAG: hypothetical protein IIB35_13760 [Gemmatimonadetes bacterium]|nr:hypothetical protein [Gemmatimonadota bacterium]MCH8936219.1 hypothetical protein [Gemmatimonadota bacterium]
MCTWFRPVYMVLVFACAKTADPGDLTFMGALVTGSVTDPGQVPIGNAEVTAVAYIDGDSVPFVDGRAATAPDGTFEITLITLAVPGRQEGNLELNVEPPAGSNFQAGHAEARVFMSIMAVSDTWPKDTLRIDVVLSPM